MIKLKEKKSIFNKIEENENIFIYKTNKKTKKTLINIILIIIINITQRFRLII